jgi:hypothetical protein
MVDDYVECLHVERNPTMTCSRSHLYKFYRYSFFIYLVIVVCGKPDWRSGTVPCMLNLPPGRKRRMDVGTAPAPSMSTARPETEKEGGAAVYVVLGC